MKAVILSTATGQGHNSASGAVASYLERHGCEVVIADVLKAGKRDASGVVSRAYSGIVRYVPWLFGMLYHAGELVSSRRRHSPIYYLNTLYSAAFLEKLNAYAPDVVVCPHLFSGQAVTYLKETGKLNVPVVSIMTDYTCSPFWEETRLEKYIIPSPLLTEEFAGRGIPRDRIIPVGIPVDARFKTKITKDQAREKLNLHADSVFAVMGGSMGCGEIPRIVSQLHRKAPQSVIVAACGNNRRLYEELSGIRNVVPMEFTPDINLIMDAADVLITKPGGLSSTEAAVKGVPIVFSRPIPGCETKNAEFFSSLHMAVVAKTSQGTAEAACEIAKDASGAREIVEAQRKYINRDADEQIGEIIMQTAGLQTMSKRQHWGNLL